MIPPKSLFLQTIILFQSLIQNIEANLDTNSCKNVIQKKNELYCEFRDLNYFFIGQSSDNLMNKDTFQIHEDLIQISNGPQVFSKDDLVITIKFRELIDENEICSLIYNTQINTYSLNCISTQPTFIIDNKFQLLINTQINLEIQQVQGFNCTQFNYNTEGFIVFCYSIHQIKLYQLSKEQHKQSVIFELQNQNQQCLLKFQQFLNSFYIIYLQCLEWKIQIYENNSFKLEIDQNLLKEKYNIQGNLLDVQTCQSHLLILLSSGGCLLNNNGKLIELFDTQELKLNETLIAFDNNCYFQFAVKNNPIITSFSKKYQDIIFDTKDFPKEILQIQYPQSIFLRYEHYFTYYINQLLHQTIKIKIQHLLKLSNQRMYLGIGEGNQITLILIKYSKQCFSFNNINHKYFLQFELTNNLFTIWNNYWNCYKPIIIDNDEQKKNYSIRINLEIKNYYMERTNYEDQFEITFLRSSFSSIQPYKMTFHSSLNQINFYQKSNLIKCQFNKYLKNYKGTFFIKIKNEQIYSIIIQGYRNQIVEYNCNNEYNRIYENILPLDEQKILTHENSNTLLLLDQQKQCIYKVILVDENLTEIPIKIYCLESQVENIFYLNNQITLKLKDQFVFYHLIYTQVQLKLEQTQLPKQISLNYEDIFQIYNDFFIVVYTNQLQIIYKSAIVQIININAKVLGCMGKSQSTLLINLILLNIIKNELQFYVVSITEFQLIRIYNLENYVPIQPLQFKVLLYNIILSCQHKKNNKMFLLIFDCKSQISFHLLQQVIETKNQFFWVQKFSLYYFDIQNELVIYNIFDITYKIEYLEFNDQSSKEVMLQLQVELENSEITPVKQDIMIKLINPSILNLIKNNSDLLIKNEDQMINFRNYILGKIDNIVLNSNDNFRLKYPLENEIFMSCSYYCNKFCFQMNNNSEYIIFFKVGQSQQTYIVYDLQLQIQNLQFIEVIKKDQFLVINQINDTTLSISLIILKDQNFKLYKQIDTYINNDLEEIQLVQNILFIQTNKIQKRFLINENNINQLDYPILHFQSKIYNLTSEIYLELMVNAMKQNILINLFKIINSQVEIQQQFKINIINYNGLINGQISTTQSKIIKLMKFNFNQENQQLDLSLFLISQSKFNAQFQIRLYLKEQKYELINNKILRYPKNVQFCKYIVITEEEIILQCGITRYYYDMNNSDYLVDPIYSTNNLQQMELLNSTHYLFQNHFEHNQSIVFYAGQRGGYMLQKLSKEIKYPISLEFQVINTDQMNTNQVILNTQVIQQDIVQNTFSQLSLMIFIMIFIIILVTIIFHYRKHKIQNKEFCKVTTKEISLSPISLEIPSKI